MNICAFVGVLIKYSIDCVYHTKPILTLCGKKTGNSCNITLKRYPVTIAAVEKQ